MNTGEEVVGLCPECGSSALYRFGRTRWGKQRFQCLICGRQFSEGAGRTEPRDRPKCTRCGATMHLYMRKGKTTRFRCSNYPVCRAYLKMETEEGTE